MDRQCYRGEGTSPVLRDCDSSLACLNISRTHYMLPSIQVKSMFSAQQDKERARMARQKQEIGEQPLSACSLRPATTTFKYLLRGIAPIAPRDYQSQFTLLDQRNSTTSPDDRSELGLFENSTAFQDYQLQLTVFDQQQRRRLNIAQQ